MFTQVIVIRAGYSPGQIEKCNEHWIQRRLNARTPALHLPWDNEMQCYFSPSFEWDLITGSAYMPEVYVGLLGASLKC